MGGVVAKPIVRLFKQKAPTPTYAAPTKAEVSQVTSTAATSTMGLSRGKGRSSTILTGAKGLGDNALTTSKRTLLGG